MPRQPHTDHFRTPKITDATTALLRKNIKKRDNFYRPGTSSTLIRSPLQPLSPMPPELPGIQYIQEKNIVCRSTIMRPPGNIDYNAFKRVCLKCMLCKISPRHASLCSVLETSEYRQVPRASPHFRGMRSVSGAFRGPQNAGMLEVLVILRGPPAHTG